jgi:Flp pilus assembly protein TadD
MAAAEQAFREALQEDGGNPGTWLHLGNTLRRKGDYREAIRCYQCAIELDENYSEAYNNLGAILSPIDAEQAERHIRAAIRLDPHNAEAYCSLGNILARRGEFVPAAIQFERALAIKPTLEAARRNLQIARAQIKALHGTDQ